MQKEYIYPDLADRSSPKEWIENEKPDLIKNTISKKKEILNRRGTKPLFTNDIDKKVRENFKIYL